MPQSMARLDARTVVADGLARHHLRDDALTTDVTQVATDLVGLHATAAPNPYLQLLVRVADFDRAMLDRELYERRSFVHVRHAVLLARKAAQCVLATRSKPVVDFSLRRTRSVEAGMHAARPRQ
jgi:hypothetical protein